MSRTSSRLDAALKQFFAPVLREDGFSGGDRAFRRVFGDFINIIEIQESEFGWEFTVQLGIQPLTIPNVLGDRPNPRTMTEELCEFRRRLTDDGGAPCWRHDGSVEGIEHAVQRAAAAYRSVGRAALLEQCRPDSPLHILTPDEFAAGQYDLSGFRSTPSRLTMALIAMRRASGEIAQARAFAQIGLTTLPSTSALRRQLESLCTESEDDLPVDGRPALTVA